MYTSILAALLVSSPVSAGEFLISASPDVVPSGRDVGGLNWVRVFNNLEDGGWWMAHHWETGGIPGYNVAPMSEGLAVDMSSRIRLAEWEQTKDHALERCPDGTFLHAYSVNVTNDSARVARYDADWNMTAHGWVEEGVDARAHNDMPLICSEHLQGVAFTNHADFRPTFFEIGTDGSVIATHEMDVRTHISGASFKYDSESDRYLMIANGEPGLSVYWINRDLTTDRSFDIAPIPSLNRHFWPQGLLRVGDYWIVTFLGEEFDGQYLAGDGDVYVAVLDDDFNTVDSIKVSDNTDGSGMGSARPSAARYRDQLLVAWDKGFLPHVSVVTLNLVSLGLDEDDSGFTPPDDTDDSSPCTSDDDDGDTDDDGSDDEGGGVVIGGDQEEDSADDLADLVGDTADDWSEPKTEEGIADDPCEKGCGCSQSQAPPKSTLILLAGMLGLVRRRR
ncbi:MAG: hypothetical protein CL930_05525 [Deltaproteobacteria bacterium]|nr:hypothetical protein [Deltaproteobacteria bacterium]